MRYLQIRVIRILSFFGILIVTFSHWVAEPLDRLPSSALVGIVGLCLWLMLWSAVMQGRIYFQHVNTLLIDLSYDSGTQELPTVKDGILPFGPRIQR
jgi:hypothetical protein